jgi:hypothetical protein
VEHLREVAAQHLDLGDEPLAAEGVGRHARPDAAGGVDPGDASLVEGDGAHVVHQAHAVDDRPARTAQVDGLTSLPEGGRALDHGDREAVLALVRRSRG